MNDLVIIGTLEAIHHNQSMSIGLFDTFFNYNAHDMLHTIERAAEYYRDHADVWKKLQERGMKGDYSWAHSAKDYIRLYESLFDEKAPESSADPEPNPVVVDIP